MQKQVWILTSFKKLQKTNDPISRKRPDRLMKGNMDELNDKTYFTGLFQLPSEVQSDINPKNAGSK